MFKRFDIICIALVATVIATAAPLLAGADSQVNVIHTNTPESVPTPSSAVSNRLPGIGSPADRLVSINQELVIGTRVMHSIAAQNGLIDDPLLSDYIQQLGVRLASGVFDEEPFSRIFPHFSLIDFPAVNAFAVPGGQIAVFTGLFALSESEAELCSVIAHEIAHVRLRHYAHSQLKGREATGTSIIGLIAGILAAFANPVAGGAVLISTLAGSVQQQLAFSRQHEYEADVFGYQYLKNAGYDTQGMISFHRRLLRLRSQNQNIEYLLTHPVSSNRISEITSRVTEDRNSQPNFWMRSVQDETIFHLMKARLLARSEIERYSSLARLTQDEPVQKYREVMRAIYKEDYTAAQKMLKKLLAKDPENAVFLYSMAEAQYAQQKYTESGENIDRIITIFPRMTPALLLGASGALKQKKPAAAFRYLRRAENTPLPYANNLQRLKLLSDAYYQDNNLVEHYLTKADYEFKTGQYLESFYHMRAAINNRYIDSEKKSRVQALMDERVGFATAGKGRR